MDPPSPISGRGVGRKVGGSSRSPRRGLQLPAVAGERARWQQHVETQDSPSSASGWWSMDSSGSTFNLEVNGWAEDSGGQSWRAKDEEDECGAREQDGLSAELGQPWYIDAHDMVLEPRAPGEHQFTLVVLHSCSGGPDDFTAFFHQLDLPFRSKVRAVVPCAPVRLENHYGWSKEQNSWFEYDNDSKDGNEVKHPEQLVEQRLRLLALLERERCRLPDGDARRMVLWGLSQGAGLALDIALHAPFTVGGVIALRGMALRDSPPRSKGSPDVEVLAINGARDWLCPPEAARTSYEAHGQRGIKLDFQVEPSLAHSCARGRQKMNKPELVRVNAFLRRIWAGL